MGDEQVPMASQMAMGNMTGPKAGRGVPEETGRAEPGRDPSRRTARMKCVRAVPAEVELPPVGTLFRPDRVAVATVLGADA